MSLTLNMHPKSARLYLDDMIVEGVVVNIKREVSHMGNTTYVEIIERDQFDIERNSNVVEEPGEKGMKTKSVAALLMDNCKTIGVQFNADGNTYTYKTIDDLEVGDQCVVNGLNGRPKVVDVVRVDKVPQIDVDSGLDYKWIVCKVDREKHDRLVEAEEKFSEVLLEQQQASVKANAQKMLAEQLGIESDALNNAIEDLNKSS